ncbi:MAG: hypothetical protein KJN89_13800 [Gammaproteobacteria bacterium]|nr:hypothetical protein [Gammaproteobacteria bacterium]NNJ51445.1 hypothetical protein [Gammaproteobacteria bacterium]
MAWLMRGKIKSKKTEQQRKKQSPIMNTGLNTKTVFDLDPQSTLASQRKGVVGMGLLHQLFECFLRVLVQHANHALSMGTPDFYMYMDVRY